MANFRCERLYVMLDEPVPGLDHLKAVDPRRFAWLDCDRDAEDLGLTPLSGFTYAPFERRQWSPVSEGLKTIRGLIGLYEGRISQARPEFAARDEALKADLIILRQVEAVLAAANTRDRRFYLAAKDGG